MSEGAERALRAALLLCEGDPAKAVDYILAGVAYDIEFRPTRSMTEPLQWLEAARHLVAELALSSAAPAIGPSPTATTPPKEPNPTATVRTCRTCLRGGAPTAIAVHQESIPEHKQTAAHRQFAKVASRPKDASKS